MKFKRKQLAIPYVLFLILFIIIPIFVIVYYAFTNRGGQFSFDNFINFFTSGQQLWDFAVTIFIALITTIICLLIGYPLSYFLARKKYNTNAVLFFLFIMPMWINFVIRTSATKDLLFMIGLNGGEHPYIMTIIGLIYNYLPFVILPLYSTMIKLDNSQMEAAQDLGCTPMQVFLKSVIPQSMPGIISAILMTFAPVMTSFVIVDAMSEGNVSVLGSIINQSFNNESWNVGSFYALIMIIIVFVSMLITNRFSAKHEIQENLW